MKRLHTDKVATLQSDIAQEHQHYVEAQQQADTNKDRVAVLEAAATSEASVHKQDVQQKDAMVCYTWYRGFSSCNAGTPYTAPVLEHPCHAGQTTFCF